MFRVLALPQSECTLNTMYIKSIFHCSRSNLWFTMPCNVTFHFTKRASPRTSSLFCFSNHDHNYHSLLCNSMLSLSLSVFGYHHYSIVIAQVVVVVKLVKWRLLSRLKNLHKLLNTEKKNTDALLIQSRGEWSK